MFTPQDSCLALRQFSLTLSSQTPKGAPWGILWEVNLRSDLRVRHSQLLLGGIDLGQPEDVFSLIVSFFQNFTTLLLSLADSPPLNEGDCGINGPVPPWVLTPWGVADSGLKIPATHRLKFVLSALGLVRTPFPGSIGIKLHQKFSFAQQLYID